MTDVLSAPQGRFELARRSVRRNDPLRAWDAADELALAHLEEKGLRAAGQVRVVIVNGGSGALAVALATLNPVVVSDSYIERIETAANLERNGFDPAVRFVDPLSIPEVSIGSPIDVLVVKIPRGAALLEDELHRLAPLLHRESVVVGAGMTKRVHTSTIELFQSIIGPTVTSRAVKKARLILTKRDPGLDAGPSPWPATLETDAGTLVNHANVFSHERLDAGTRFLLSNLPGGPLGEVVDLGCGNGIVGSTLARRDPAARVTFVDESFMAVASARATFIANGGDPSFGRFVVGDGLFSADGTAAAERGTVDLIVNTPPFHDDQSQGDEIAWQMFTESHAALRPGGELRAVGNRHLAYHAKLKRIFGNCRVVAANDKYVVYSAVR
ncbi:MAG TPA: methyltransferase [Microthrixaceae bacterium]|nr:methyltransferase [Microthrixaceae bacterium]